MNCFGITLGKQWTIMVIQTAFEWFTFGPLCLLHLNMYLSIYIFTFYLLSQVCIGLGRPSHTYHRWAVLTKYFSFLSWCVLETELCTSNGRSGKISQVSGKAAMILGESHGSSLLTPSVWMYHVCIWSLNYASIFKLTCMSSWQKGTELLINHSFYIEFPNTGVKYIFAMER